MISVHNIMQWTRMLLFVGTKALERCFEKVFYLNITFSLRGTSHTSISEEHTHNFYLFFIFLKIMLVTFMRTQKLYH